LHRKFSQLLEKYKEDQIKNYDECYHHKNLYMMGKTMDFIPYLLSDMVKQVQGQSSYSTKQLKRNCESAFNRYMKERDVAELYYDKFCQKFRGK
jgi:hypothetical protein